MDYEKIFYEFLKDFSSFKNVAVAGTGNAAQCLALRLQKMFPEVNIFCYFNSYKEGVFEGKPVYLSQKAKDLKDKIDAILVSSYSGREFFKNLFESQNIKNVFYIDKEVFDALKYAEYEGKAEKYLHMFHSDQDKNLWKMVVRARKDFDTGELKDYFLKMYGNWKTAFNCQYFDFINKPVIKTALDCGGYNGATSLAFMNKFENIEKVYCFEPMYEKFKNEDFDTLIKKEPRIKIVEYGVWSEKAFLDFIENPAEINSSSGFAAVQNWAASKNTKHEKIPVISIDEFVKENSVQKVDFIKMDIENAEMEALLGARNTIEKHRPQLAVCIYHSEEQLFQIPLYLEKSLKNYVFKLGHYNANHCETIFYAIPSELFEA